MSRMTTGCWHADLGKRSWGWEAALIPMCLASVGYSAFVAPGQLVIGALTIEPTDVAFVIALVCAAIAYYREGMRDVAATTWLCTVTLMLLFLFPVLIGLTQGHHWETALRPARLGLYWSLLVLVPALVASRASAERLLLALSATAVGAGVLAVVSFLAGWAWLGSGRDTVPTSQGVVVRGFGLPSALPWYCLGALLCLSYALFSSAGRYARIVVGAGGVFLAAITIATLGRGNYLALVFGLLAIGVLAVVKYGSVRALLGAIGWRRLLSTLAVLIVCIGIVGAIRPSYFSLVIERTASVFETGTSYGADFNRELRTSGMREGLRSAVEAPLGIGYGWGDAQRKLPRLSERTVAYYGTHSGIAWVGLYLGIAGAVILFMAAVPVVVRLAWGCSGGRSMWWGSVAVASLIVALVAQSAGSAVLFGTPETLGMIPIIVGLGFLLTRVDPASLSPSRRAGFALPRAAYDIPEQTSASAIRRAWATLTSVQGLLARIAAVAGMCLVAFGGVLWAVSSTGRAVRVGSTLYGQVPTLVVHPGASGVSSEARVIQVTRSFAGSIDLWYLAQAGSVTAYVAAYTDGEYEIRLSAYGTLAGGKGPAVMLRVDDTVVEPIADVAVRPLEHTWRVPLDAGVHRIAFDYVNDAVIEGQDRNLFVESFSIAALQGTQRPTLSKREEWKASVLELPASELSVRTSGRPVSEDVIHMWENGEVGERLLVEQSGVYRVGVVAKGSTLDGVGPRLRLVVDGDVVGEAREVGKTWGTATWAVRLTTGEHLVAVRFDNDAASDEEDRNVTIRSLSVRSRNGRAAPQVVEK